PLYAEAVRQGVPLPAAWSGYAQHARDCLPLPTHYLTAREVLQFRDEAFTRYYTGSDYLDMVGRHFGPAAVKHVRDMASHRLERDLLSGKLDPSSTLWNVQKVEPAGKKLIQQPIPS